MTPTQPHPHTHTHPTPNLGGCEEDLSKKTATDGTDRQTNGHGDPMTDPAQRAESVKNISCIHLSFLMDVQWPLLRLMLLYYFDRSQTKYNYNPFHNNNIRSYPDIPGRYILQGLKDSYQFARSRSCHRQYSRCNLAALPVFSTETLKQFSP